MNKKNKLILFDIDGTLLSFATNEKLHNRLCTAVNKTFNVNVKNEMIDINGKPDKRIMIELAGVAGISRSEVLNHLKQIYKNEIEYSKKNIKYYDARPAKGVVKLLQTLRKEKYPLGLITGNIKYLSKLKLEKTGLWKFFKTGAYGELSENRTDLVNKVIADSKKKFRTNFSKNNIFYFGDAPLDIIAGNGAGIKVIAVATGVVPITGLKKYKPAYLMKDMSDTKKIMKIIES